MGIVLWPGPFLGLGVHDSGGGSTSMIQPGTRVHVLQPDYRTGTERETVGDRVYVVTRLEGTAAWIQSERGGPEYRIAVRLLVVATVE